MGILDDFSGFIKTPEGLGIAGAIAGGMAGARRNAPWNTLGAAGMGGLLGYSNAIDRQDQQKAQGLMNQMRELQISDMLRQAKTRDLFEQAMQGDANQVSALQQGADVGDIGPTLTNATRLQTANVATPSSASYTDKVLSAAIKAGDVDAYNKAMTMKLEEKKLAPKYSTDVRTVSINGVPTPVQMADDGSWKIMGEGVTPAEKLNFQNIGNRTVGLNPFTGQEVSTIRNTMSPDAAAANALGWANYNKPQFVADAGGFVTLPTKANPSGSLIALPGFSKQPTGEQARAIGFLDRMTSAEKILSDPKIASGEMPGVIEGVVGSLPLIGDYSANQARSPNRQQYRQAQEDWVRAKLRKESGAAIGKDEMDREISQYFPTQGDSPEVIAQKAESRRTALSALGNETGRTSNPEVTKASSKAFKIDGGGSVIGKLGDDGNYYVVKNGKKYMISE